MRPHISFHVLLVVAEHLKLKRARAERAAVQKIGPREVRSFALPVSTGAGPALTDVVCPLTGLDRMVPCLVFNETDHVQSPAFG